MDMKKITLKEATEEQIRKYADFHLDEFGFNKSVNNDNPLVEVKKDIKNNILSVELFFYPPNQNITKFGIATESMKKVFGDCWDVEIEVE